MKRSQAGLLVKRCEYLTAAERLVFLALLDVADNGDCAVPAYMTPTIPVLAGWTHLGRTTVKRAVNHLASHGWLTCEAGSGRGNKSNYRLVPDAPDLECQCEKGPQRTPLATVKGSIETPKRVQIEHEKGPTSPEFPQVNASIALRDSREDKGVVVPEGSHEDFAQRLAAFKSCHSCASMDTQIIGPYRFCREHAGPRWKERSA